MVSATNGLGINIYAHSKHLPAAELLWAWLTNKATETLMSNDGYIWGSMPSVDSGYVGYWAKKGVDVAPFLKEQKGKTFILGEAPNADRLHSDGDGAQPCLLEQGDGKPGRVDGGLGGQFCPERYVNFGEIGIRNSLLPQGARPAGKQVRDRRPS